MLSASSGNADGRGNYGSHLFAWKTKALPPLPGTTALPGPDQPWEEARAVGGWLSNVARGYRLQQIASLPGYHTCEYLHHERRLRPCLPTKHEHTRAHGTTRWFTSTLLSRPRKPDRRKFGKSLRPGIAGMVDQRQTVIACATSSAPPPRPPPFLVWPLSRDNKTIATYVDRK